jgi:hypothetical protein
MASEHDNAHAIARLTRTSQGNGYRLPNIAQYWFALPEKYFAMGMGNKIFRQFVTTRIPGRIRRALKTPLGTIRRAIRR